MFERTKGFFQRLGERWEAAVSRVGGNREKRNLLGVLLDVGAGLVTAPLKIIGGTGKFLGLLFKEPHQAGLYLQFLGWKVGQTLLCVLGIKKVWHPPNSWSKTGFYEYTGKERAAWVGYIIFMMWLFLPMAIELGAMGVAWFLFLSGPIAILAITLPSMIRRWRSIRFETWLTKRDAQKKEDLNYAQQEQQEAQERLAQANQDTDAYTGMAPEMQRQFHALQAQAAQAEKERDMALADLRARDEELKAEGQAAGTIAPKERKPSLVDQFLGEGPKLLQEVKTTKKLGIGPKLITDAEEVE